MHPADERRDYQSGALHERDLAPDPVTQFTAWLQAAVDAGVPDATAATLATADAEGCPSARMVLLKGVDDGAFVFFTNWESRKAGELDSNPRATMLFFWRELERQVRVQGTARRVSAEQADAYFATRPRDSQLGAWASPQSAVVPDREALERAYRDAAERFGDVPVPRPAYWGGYALTPDEVEFWQGRTSRLHDRLCYRRVGDGWRVDRLAP